MLADRYKLDREPVVPLNPLQRAQRRMVEEKIADGRYQFERINCVVCGGNSFEQLSEKDRYGLALSVVVCTECGLIFTSPRMTGESYAAFYESDYRKLYVGEPVPTDAFFERQRHHGVAIQDFVETIISAQKPFTGKFVVEIGTGAGGILQAFKDAGNDVLGTDLGSEYLAFGRERGLDLRRGTVDEFLALGRPADLVIYSHVLEHTLNPVAELAKVRSALAPGGLVYLEVPGVKALTHSYKQDFLRSLQNAHTYYFSLRTLQNAAGGAQMTMVAGDEDIRSLFRADTAARTYRSDHTDVMMFLRGMETRRLNTNHLARFRSRARRFTLRLGNLVGITGLMKKWYYRLKYRR